jgi:hypothetical protein
VCVCIYVHMSILLSTQGKMIQWIIENNLADLLEYTPGLKTLHVTLAFSIDFGGLARTPPTLARPCPPDMLTLTLPGQLSAIWTYDPRIKRALPCSPKGYQACC